MVRLFVCVLPRNQRIPEFRIQQNGFIMNGQYLFEPASYNFFAISNVENAAKLVPDEKKKQLANRILKKKVIEKN